LNFVVFRVSVIQQQQQQKFDTSAMSKIEQINFLLIKFHKIQIHVFYLATKLIPIKISMHMKKNMKEHSTIYYDIRGLFLRRGQEFSFLITFNQAFHEDKYHLSVIFKPQTWSNFPIVIIPLNGSSNGWSAKSIPIEDQKDNQICFQINSPSDAIIGKYSVNISKKKTSFLLLYFYIDSFYSKFVQLINKILQFFILVSIFIFYLIHGKKMMYVHYYHQKKLPSML